MLTLNSLGNKFDDMREAVLKEIAGWSGAKRALKEAAKNVGSLASHVDKDLEEGLVPGDLVTAEYTKKYIGRAAAALENLELRAQNLEFVANGKLEAMDKVIQSVKKDYDKEIADLELYEKALSLGVDPESAGRPDSPVREENSQAAAAADIDQRRLEAKEKKAMEAAQASSAEPKKVKTRRSRSKKNNAKNT